MHFHGRGLCGRRQLPRLFPLEAAARGQRASPLSLAPLGSSPKGRALGSAAKFPGELQSDRFRRAPLPLGELPPQRLRGYRWRAEKKSLSEAARFFPVRLPLWGLKGASSPFPVAGWVESRGREGGVGTPLPTSGPAERPARWRRAETCPAAPLRRKQKSCPGFTEGAQTVNGIASGRWRFYGERQPASGQPAPQRHLISAQQNSIPSCILREMIVE